MHAQSTLKESAMRSLPATLCASRAVAMLVQTDKFGTSVAQSLRVHSDTLRTKRRQRAEEAAAKTGVKMVFPLVRCIFPAIWVVTLGPAAIKIVQVLVPIAEQ
jgi:tight adherence protein C